MSRAWRLAHSLIQLRAQLDSAYPTRSRVSDGSIGDAAHAASVSDHNPDSGGVVRAIDITHDPVGGVDGNQLAGALLRNRDPRIKYVIWNRRIFAGNAGPAPWQWRAYSGSNPHDHHVHVSVIAGSTGEKGVSWKLALPQEENEVTPEQLKQAIREVVNEDGLVPSPFIASNPSVAITTALRYAMQWSLGAANNSAALIRAQVDVDQLADEVVAQLRAQLGDAPDIDTEQLAALIVTQLVDRAAGEVAP